MADYLEKDYYEAYDPNAKGEFIPNTKIEVIRSEGRGHFTHALFDFDGTFSLIREGWQTIMFGLMFEVLKSTPNHESDEELTKFIDTLILETTGKQTIYQMIDLAEEVKKRGGIPLEPLDYKKEYSDRLMVKINDRREGLRNKTIEREELLVPGTLDMLRGLKEKGVTMYCASGTDDHFCKEEAHLLGVDEFFGDNIYGALDDYKKSSKALVIKNILEENNLSGEVLLGFGDGFVEIEAVKSVGGYAVGIAIDEKNLNRQIDERKKSRLLGVGADIIIPDFLDAKELITYLF
ncbi:MAG: HAD family hydrolase [Abditibacteriota bacterium]|nr:HAD family hydrolase [Abditibacteriota bacterium]